MVEGEVIDSDVRGAVQVGRGSRIVDSNLIGPVVIGEDVQVLHSTIGPEASIGDGSQVTDAAIESSIVMDRSSVFGWKIRSSILGRETRLRGAPPAAFVEMMLGEHSEIE
jgi:glucose-1-phosphate thymidylyltransferase